MLTRRYPNLERSLGSLDPLVIPGLNSFKAYQRAIEKNDNIDTKMRMAAGAASLFGLPGLVLMMKIYTQKIADSLDAGERVSMESNDAYKWAKVAERLFAEFPEAQSALKSAWPELDFNATLTTTLDQLKSQIQSETQGTSERWLTSARIAATSIIDNCKSDFEPKLKSEIQNKK